jgi:hypothetical protein
MGRRQAGSRGVGVPRVGHPGVRRPRLIPVASAAESFGLYTCGEAA